MSIIEKIRHFQRTPGIDVEGMIRSFGINFTKERHLHPDIVGQIERQDHGFLISVQPNDHENRQRFTAAHELGHYLMHRDLLGDGIDDNRMYRSANVGRFYNRNISQRHETEANNFAADVLMPEHLIASRHVAKDGNLRELAKEFRVSPVAMRIRLENLGLHYHE